MPIEPSIVEYKIGTTIYKQPLRLVKNRGTAGQPQWVLCRDQADQRDDSVVIAGLTREIILQMAEIVR